MKIYYFDNAKRISYASDSTVCLVKDSNRSNFEELHRHDYYELVYIYSGSGVHTVNGISYSVQSGNMIFLHPDDSHSFYSTDKVSMINVCFTQTDGLSYFPEHRTENQIITISESSMIEFETILYLMERLLKQKDYLYEDAVNKYLDLLLLILNRHFSNHLTCDPLWGELLSYLSENYNTVTLQKAAEIVGISVSHFCRIFKRDFSTTFHDYVNNIRMQRAKYLLTYTNETISWIADSVGYGNCPCRFYQNFKSIVGTTPSNYRKITQKKEFNQEFFSSSIPDNPSNKK